jgi:hypothetical protein
MKLEPSKLFCMFQHIHSSFPVPASTGSSPQTKLLELPQSAPLSCIHLLPCYQLYFALQEFLKFRKQQEVTEPDVANGEAVSPVEFFINLAPAEE